eukprot:4677769-Pyramimonas_sp.AAC.1
MHDMTGSMGPELAHRQNSCFPAWKALRYRVFKHAGVQGPTPAAAMVFLDSLVCSGRLFQASAWGPLTVAQHRGLQDGLL